MLLQKMAYKIECFTSSTFVGELATNNSRMHDTLQLFAHVRIGFITEMNYVGRHSEFGRWIPHTQIGIVSFRQFPFAFVEFT